MTASLLFLLPLIADLEFSSTGFQVANHKDSPLIGIDFTNINAWRP